MGSKKPNVSETPTGYVETTPRGFRQDADNAMKGDLVRGLIEAITNCDDAYGDEPGKIKIDIGAKDAGSFQVVIADRARGIPAAEMKQKLLRAGERTSGHEVGQRKRGNRGRGAKDLSAFGSVVFESIAGDEYARLKIDRGGAFYGPMTSRVTPEDRKRLSIPKNGMVTTITCRGVARSRFDNLKRRLVNAVALRRILQDDERDVLFEYTGEKTTRLQFAPPTTTSTIFTGQLDVEGYGPANLQLFESSEPFNDVPSDMSISRVGGIVITSENACHEATLFSLEGNPYAERIFGFCDFPVIDKLIREYDDRDDKNDPQLPSNPCPIVRRDRDGLEHNHPAYVALKKAIEPILNEYVKKAAAKNASGQKQSDAARRRNQNTANALAKWMVEQEHELDIDTDPVPVDETFRIIPPLKYIDRGTEQTFSVRVGGYSESDKIQARLDYDCDDGVEATPSTTLVEMVWEESEAGCFHRGSFRLTAGNVDGAVFIQAWLLVNGLDAGSSAEATVNIEEPRQTLPPEPPAAFMFDRKTYTVKAGRRKKLLLLAPAEVVQQYGAEVRVQSSDDKGVTVGGGNRTRLEPVDEGWYEAEVLIEGKQLGAQARVTARIEGHVYRAETTVRVREDDIPSFRIEPKALPGNVRAAWLKDQDGVVIQVNAIHPAARRYFGPEDENFPYVESLAARMLIAEVVADEAVRQTLKDQAEKHNQQLDAEAFYAKRLVLLADLLPKLHKEQLSDADVNSLNEQIAVQPERAALASAS